VDERRDFRERRLKSAGLLTVSCPNVQIGNRRNVASTTFDDGILLNLIDQLGRLEWKKKQTRYPSSWIENRFQRVNYSGYPPYCSFRFLNEDSTLIANLKSAVVSYGGKVEWVMVGHERGTLPGTNWMICPKRYWEVRGAAESAGVSTGQYMAEHEPCLGPLAYEDLIGLTNHIQARMKLPE
jgi:hypothetical protein